MYATIFIIVAKRGPLIRNDTKIYVVYSAHNDYDNDIFRKNVQSKYFLKCLSMFCKTTRVCTYLPEHYNIYFGRLFSDLFIDAREECCWGPVIFFARTGHRIRNW